MPGLLIRFPGEGHEEWQRAERIHDRQKGADRQDDSLAKDADRELS